MSEYYQDIYKHRSSALGCSSGDVLIFLWSELRRAKRLPAKLWSFLQDISESRWSDKRSIQYF